MTDLPKHPLASTAERLGYRLRAVANGFVVLDSLDAVVRTAPGTTPQYLVPRSDVRIDTLAAGSVRDAGEQGDYVSIAWPVADRWYAEDEEIIGHARDPRHRVDALRSSRHVEVVVGDTLVACSDRPTVLVETDVVARYFVPRVDVIVDLRRSATVTASPYLGVATHWSMTVGGERHDIAVSYDSPCLEVAVLEHLIAFDERLAEVYVSAPYLGGVHDGTTA